MVSEVTGMRGMDKVADYTRSGKGWPSSTSYLGRHLFVDGLVFSPSLGLRVVEGRLGLGVSACR